MTMRRNPVRFNYSDYLLLPEDKRYEILDGDLYMIASPDIQHQRVSLRLTLALAEQTKNGAPGEILEAPCDVILSEDNIVQPDILFVRKEHAGIVGTFNVQGAPDLVIEILSEGTRSKDLELKGKIYGRFGVQEYWIVDPDASTIEALAWSELGYLSAGVFRKSDRMSSPLLPKLKFPLREIFN